MTSYIKPSSLSKEQWKELQHSWNSTDVTLEELAKQVNVLPACLKQTISNLRKEGYFFRSRPPGRRKGSDSSLKEYKSLLEKTND